MGLEKRVVSINFAQGVDTKTDAKLTTKLTTADNVVLRKNGTIEKRLGFSADGIWSLTANPVRVFPFRDGEFVVTDWQTDGLDATNDASGSTLTTPHAISRLSGTWQTRLGANSTPQTEDLYNVCTIRTRTLLSDSGSITAIDLAIVNSSATQEGSALYNYFGLSSSNTSMCLADLDSEEHSWAPGGYGFAPPTRIIGLGSSSTIVVAMFPSATSSTTLTLRGISATNSLFNSVASINGSETVNRQLDAVAINNKVYFATKANSSTNIILGVFDPGLQTISSTTIPGSTTADMLTIAVPAPGTDRVRLFWMKNSVSSTAFMASYSLTLSQILASTTIAVGVGGYGPIIQIAACENAGLTSVGLYYSQSSTTASPTYSGWNADYNNAGSAIASGLVGEGNLGSGGFQSCVLAAKPFLAHNKPHLLLNFTATGQQSFVVAKRWYGYLQPVARALYGLAGPNNSSSYMLLPGVTPGKDSDTFWSPVRRAVFYRSTAGSITINYGAEAMRLNFSQTQPTPYTGIAGATYLGGGFLSMFDSFGVQESGFLSFPSIVTVSLTTTGGNLGAASTTYSVLVLKEFTDHTGKTHRGIPSLSYSFQTSTTTGQAVVQFTDGPNLKSQGIRRGQIRYSIFRTQGNGSIYYRDVSTSFTSSFVPSLTAISITLTSSDASLSGGDVIYTQGGALPNWTPDSPEFIFQHNNRIFCPDPTDDTILRFSKEVVEGEGVAFAQANIVRVPGAGRQTAGASLDSNGIVFRARQCLAFNGQGPDDTGQNGAFSNAQILLQDVGCINQRNLCRFRDGIVFKSPDKGFYLLTRDLQLQYIGQDVEAYNGKTVISAEVVGLAEIDGTAEECRFLCSDGTLLIYNYYNGQWTTATLSGCTDAVYSGGRYIVVNPSTTAANARVFQQSLSTYTDDFMSPGSVTYQMTVETGWIKTGDIQGFQRIYKAGLLGEAQGPGKIVVEVGYDYESAYNEAHTATMSSLTAANYTGGATAAPQTDWVPNRQKCQAIRFRIKDIPDPGGGAVMKLTNISLECGIKSGKFLLPASKGI